MNKFIYDDALNYIGAFHSIFIFTKNEINEDKRLVMDKGYPLRLKEKMKNMDLFLADKILGDNSKLFYKAGSVGITEIFIIPFDEESDLHKILSNIKLFIDSSFINSALVCTDDMVNYYDNVDSFKVLENTKIQIAVPFENDNEQVVKGKNGFKQILKNMFGG